MAEAQDFNPATNLRPRGKSSRWDEALIIALALVGAADLALAALLWRRLSAVPYRDLPNATPVNGGRASRGAQRPELWFDTDLQQYGTGDRGAVPQPNIQSAVEDFAMAAVLLHQNAVRSVFRGQTEISAWQDQTAQDLRLIGLAAAIIGVGGTAEVDGDTMNGVTERTHYHLDRLNSFALDIENGILTEERAVRRAGLYPVSVVRSGYAAARLEAHQFADYDEELNELDLHADHCLPDPARGTEGCPELTALGWVPIGTLPPIGERSCVFNCKCYIRYRRGRE